MTIIDTPDTLNTLPVWSVLGSLRAADLNILSEWQRWLYEAADGLPASPLLRPAYRWDLTFSGEVERRYGDLALIHQHRYLVYLEWGYDNPDAPQGAKIKTVNGWAKTKEESLADASEQWVTVDLSQYDWLFIGMPYHITGAKYAVESDVPYEF